MLVRLGIEKAYDRVFCDGPRVRLHKLGLRGRLLSLISDFLANRRYRVVRPGTSEYQEFEIGLPQGSSMSPLFFTLFIADCADELWCTDIEFADDITLLYTGTEAFTVVSMLNHDLAVIERWARKMRVVFGDKTTYFLFRPKFSAPINVEAMGGLHFFGAGIPRAEKCVLLGMHLDEHLTFSRHVDHLETVATKRVNRLRSLKSGRLVDNADALLILYKGWIRSLIEYGNEVYSTVAPYWARRLERIQNACLRTILGARENTPAEIVNNEAGVSSLQSRREQSVLRMYYKVLAKHETHPLRRALSKWWSFERIRESLSPRPRSFFGVVVESHLRVLQRPAPQKAPGLANPVPLPPWNPFHIPHKKIDVQQQHRREIRKGIRVQQMMKLRARRATKQYVHWHPPQRRDWMKCLPVGGAYLRIIIRLRSGYADIGPCGHYGDTLPCPNCKGRDDVPHILRDCPAYTVQRSQLYIAASRIAGRPATMTDLLGFSSTLSTQRLRAITTLTAKFIISVRRFV